ncbi:geobacillin-26 family protein [Bengtsoniella intestinalis]|uniref:geobacillin-26 family protein n=1 Tax=Bengtsoniella intestinalis TaxID=3073143 RepID=UPI00391F6B06
MKKLLSIILSLAMIFSLTATAFASELTTNTIPGVTILEDNSDFRIAQAIDDNYRYVFTYNKADNTMLSERFSIDGDLEVSAFVDIDEQTIYDSQTGDTASTYAVVASQYTDSVYAYEYTNDNPKEWKLVRAKYADEDNEGGYYFKTKQTTINEDNLDEFRVAVDGIASKESTLKTQVGVTAFLAGVSTGFAIGAGPAGWGIAAAGYFAAAGFGTAAQVTTTQIAEYQSTALARYTDVKNQSDIFF